MSKPPHKPSQSRPPSAHRDPGPRAERRDHPRHDDDERMIPVAVMGLGEIGIAVARAARAHPRLELVGAIDQSPTLGGRSLGELLGDPSCALSVSRELAPLAKKLQGGVLLLCTGSRVEEVAPQLFAAFEKGLCVVSTCEELAYPWLYHEELAEELDEAARAAGVSALGTGVNPGFVLDRLIAVAGACTGKISHVLAERVVDARTRRLALQKKIGAGLSEEAFDALAERDGVGHVGLAESCALAALGLGLDCDEVEEELAAVVAEEDIDGPVPVKAGQVAGITQTARAFAEGRELVRLELTIAVGAEPVGDSVKIEGEPNLELVIEGGTEGELATAWAVVNAVTSVVRAEPGVCTVLDLPVGR